MGGGSIINKISTINQGGLVKRLKKCIYHSVFLLLLIVLVLYTGTGCGNSGGVWHIADSLVVDFYFSEDNVEHEAYDNDFPDIIRIMLPNQNYNDTLYYVLNATIYGIDNSAYTIDQYLTKWVAINDTFANMNMKIVIKGNSIINYPWAGGMEFIDTLKIVRLSDENGISAMEGINSAFSFNVAVYNKKAKEYEYYQKDFDMSFKKSMKIEVDLTYVGSSFLEDDFNLYNIFDNFKNLINDEHIVIDAKMTNVNIPDPPSVDSTNAGWDELLEYSHLYHNSALIYENYQDTSDERSIEVIIIGMGGIEDIGHFGVTNSSNGNYLYYREGSIAYNNPIFLNIPQLHNLIMYHDQYYWEGEIGNSEFDWDAFRTDMSEAVGMILAHEIGHNVGRLLDESNPNAKNQGFGYNVMYVPGPNDTTSLTMACYLDRYFALWQKEEILKISQFYFKGNN